MIKKNDTKLVIRIRNRYSRSLSTPTRVARLSMKAPIAGRSRSIGTGGNGGEIRITREKGVDVA